MYGDEVVFLLPRRVNRQSEPSQQVCIWTWREISLNSTAFVEFVGLEQVAESYSGAQPAFAFPRVTRRQGRRQRIVMSEREYSESRARPRRFRWY
jgi:hypothetical protein